MLQMSHCVTHELLAESFWSGEAGEAWKRRGGVFLMIPANVANVTLCNA